MNRFYYLELDADEILTLSLAIQTATRTIEQMIPVAKAKDDRMAEALFTFEKLLFEEMLVKVKTLTNEAQ